MTMHKQFRLIILILSVSGLLFAAGSGERQEVNIYSHRHYDADQALYAAFEEETGIRVNVVTANADELIQRLKSEGELSPADLLITADAGRLGYAKELGLLQPGLSEVINEHVPAAYRDPEGFWVGLTLRGRVIVYDTAVTDGSVLSTYEALAGPLFRNQILIRSSSNIYNQSLLASLIAHNGPEDAEVWAKAMVENMAREPKGNDRDQMKALIAGEGRYAVVNTYYIGLLLNSTDPYEQEVGERIGVFFPNQQGRGTHINISGAGVAAHAPNRENAVRLLEFLTSESAQALFAQANYEYPVREGIALNPTVAEWGTFRRDTLNLSMLGELNTEAVMIFDRAGWR